MKSKLTKLFMLSLILLFSFSILTGCGRDRGKDDKEPEEEVIKIEEPEEEEIAFVCPLSNLPTEEDDLLLRPFMILYDNSFAARPQAGISEAPIVYELLSEGNITRLLALFNKPIEGERIGPVRSARHYFVHISKEHDAVLAHVGGSEQGKAELQNIRAASLDQFANGSYYWRDTTRKAPHNVYTTIEKMREGTEARNMYNEASQMWDLSFSHKVETSQKPSAEEINLSYGGNHTVTYQYDQKSNSYNRFINQRPHIDGNSDETISVNNIIIQFAPHRVIDSVGRRDISLVGEGKGFLITNGQEKEIKWSKSSKEAMTSFKYTNGNDIELSPGNTWIQILPSENSLEIRSFE